MNQEENKCDDIKPKELQSKEWAKEYSKEIIEGAAPRLSSIQKLIEEACKRGEYTITYFINDNIDFILKQLNDKGYCVKGQNAQFIISWDHR